MSNYVLVYTPESRTAIQTAIQKHLTQATKIQRATKATTIQTKIQRVTLQRSTETQKTQTEEQATKLSLRQHQKSLRKCSKRSTNQKIAQKLLKTALTSCTKKRRIMDTLCLTALLTEFSTGFCGASSPGADGRPGGGTTGGSVYGSNDRGESWSQLTRDLPKILCVEAFADA